MIKLRKFWELNLFFVLLLWIIIAVITRPGWIYFGLGFLVWLTLVFLTAPGVFWNYAAIFFPTLALGKKILERAVSSKPLIPAPYLSLGLCYARRREWSKAIPLLEEAVEHTPKSKKSQNLFLLAEAYRASGDNEKALSILKELSGKGINSMKMSLNLALVLFQLNRYPEALECAKKARVYDLSSIEPVLIQAKINFAAGEYQQAKSDYHWAIDHLKWPVESLYWLGRAELELGETDAAVAHLRTAVERITEDPLLSDVGKDEAEEWLNRALKNKQ